MCVRDAIIENRFARNIMKLKAVMRAEANHRKKWVNKILLVFQAMYFWSMLLGMCKRYWQGIELNNFKHLALIGLYVMKLS